MYILAWILFVMFIISFTFRTSVVIGKAIAMTNYYNDVKIDINLYRLVLDIIAFVFVCIYLFAK